MKRNLPLIVGLVLLIAGGVGVVIVQGGESDGMATGRGSKADVLWNRLQELRDPYLEAWMGAYDKKRPAPSDVLEAWNEVALQVTGPGGFWRRQVPDRWMGCAQLPDSSACGTLAIAEEGEFRKYDAISEAIHDMDGRKARRYLNKHFDDMVGYLDHYVPADTTSPDMKKTPFFKQNLEGAMRSDGML